MRNQKICIANDGVIRFKQNIIVSKLLDFAIEHGYSLNNIAVDFDTEPKEKDNEDYKQLMQLIGYSVSGYGDLNCVPFSEALYFENKASKLIEETLSDE